MSDASIFGLIMAGGFSRRLGMDKAHIHYRGMPHWRFLHNEMAESGLEWIFVSIRPSQRSDFEGPVNFLPDNQPGLGPMAALIDAHRKNPKVAWLVLAADMPFADRSTVGYLIENRNPAKAATIFHTDEKNHPEPMAAIYEPVIFEDMLLDLAKGQRSLTKFLKAQELNLISPPDPHWLANVNTPEDYRRVMTIFRGGSKSD